MRTIKQLADELGVSKTAIRKYMAPEFRASHTQTSAGNVIEIDEEGCKLIAEIIKKPPETTGNQFPKTSENQSLQEEIIFLRAQIEVKDKQIEQLQASLAEEQKQGRKLTELTDRLAEVADHAQSLHAGTMRSNNLLPDGEKKKKSRWLSWFSRGE